MHRRRTFEIVGLGALTIITAALAIAAVAARPTVVTAIPAPVNLPTMDPSTVWPSDTAKAPTTPPATPSTKSTPTPTPAPTQTALNLPKNGLTALAKLLDAKQPGSILVLGDGSGDGADEWVALWVRDYLAKQHQVSYAAWNVQTGDYDAPTAYGSGGVTLTVWNASHGKPDLTVEPAHVDEAWRGADIVIYSYGHGQTSSALTKALPAIRSAVRGHNGAIREIVMVQNPERADSEVRQRAATQTVQDWADRAGLASLDIYSAFVADLRARNQLVLQNGAPTPAGSALWAKTLNKALASR